MTPWWLLDNLFHVFDHFRPPRLKTPLTEPQNRKCRSKYCTYDKLHDVSFQKHQKLSPNSSWAPRSRLSKIIFFCIQKKLSETTAALHEINLRNNTCLLLWISNILNNFSNFVISNPFFLRGHCTWIWSVYYSSRNPSARRVFLEKTLWYLILKKIKNQKGKLKCVPMR